MTTDTTARTAADAGVRAVDSHAHVFRHDLPMPAQRRHTPDYDAPLADYLRLLQAHAVSHAVLVQPSFLGTDNSFLLSAIARHPSMLRGVAVVDPGIDAATLQALHAGGIRGLRLNLVGVPLPDLAQPGWQAVLAQVRALGWHAELHCGAVDLARAGQPILDAGCRLVVDHFGLPGPAAHAAADWLARAAEGGRTWVKLSAAYRNWPVTDTAGPRQMARRLLQTFGAGRLVWGSDWPHTQHRHQADYAGTHAALADWVPDAADRQQILADTPAALFHFTPGDTHATTPCP